MIQQNRSGTSVRRAATSAIRRSTPPGSQTLRLLVLFAAGFIILLTSCRRTRLGVAGAQGELMLVDLRDRIQSQSLIPPLPPGYFAESALRSAGGTPFAGDFVITVCPPDTDRFEVVVVDVSGKGESAGTRALL